jgi:hypothetical protein
MFEFAQSVLGDAVRTEDVEQLTLQVFAYPMLESAHCRLPKLRGRWNPVPLFLWIGIEPTSAAHKFTDTEALQLSAIVVSNLISSSKPVLMAKRRKHIRLSIALSVQFLNTELSKDYRLRILRHAVP